MPGALACTLTEPCAMQLSGLSLASSNTVRIVASGVACGTGSPATSTFVGLAGTTSATAPAYKVYDFALGPVTGGTAGALYRICWAARPSVVSDFSVDFGIFTLNGPLTLAISKECPMTVACRLQVSGTGLISSNTVKVVHAATGCTASAATPVGYTGAIFISNASSSTYSDVFDFGTTTAGLASADFQVC